MGEIVSKQNWEVDPNMVVVHKEPLRLGRFSTALVLIKDRFIFALGGNISKTSATKKCEVYDINCNSWY